MYRKIGLIAILLMMMGVSSVLRASDGSAAEGAKKDAAPNKPEAATTSGVAQVEQKPAPRESIQVGAEIRFRSENWNNTTDYNSSFADRRNQYRFRTRLWIDVPVTKKIEFYVGLVNEFKKQDTPDLKIDIDEMVFESLYVTLKDIGKKGVTLRVGRQNLMRGDGFILMDGNPSDGSRSMYSNSAVLGYTWKKSTIELMGILDPARDRMLPRINDKEKALVDWEEQALGLYYTDRNHKSTDWDSYYFYKKEINDPRPATNALFQPDRNVHTAGSRIVHRFARGITSSSEGGFQWGAQHPSTEVRAWGGYSTVRKDLNRSGKPYFLAGYIALSGDDSKTKNTVEGWDPLFSRYPRWSDLYPYEQSKEKAVGYWSNLHMSQAEFGVTPRNNLSLRTTWYHMRAFHAISKAPIFGDGTTRGDLLQFRADYKLNDHLRGHLVYEAMVPGTFYCGDSYGYFVRGELIYTWKKAF